ncbi:MAG TPA: MJ0307 family thioredoxin [archaeon]|nr:MJ0307 family thioredoxin [archaeon]
MPVKIEVFCSPYCPHCPRAVEVVNTVAKRFGEKVTVEEINTFTPEGEEKADAYGIFAVPTIVINGKVKFTGAPSEQEFLATITAEVEK